MKINKYTATLFATMFISSPVLAENRREYNYQKGYSTQQSCYRYVYREEYVPGISTNPGYVKTYNEKIEVPCRNYEHVKVPSHNKPIDDNSCLEGSILGGIAGGGAGAALSRGNGRWWAIPLGIVGGTLVGCQVDGG